MTPHKMLARSNEHWTLMFVAFKLALKIKTHHHASRVMAKMDVTNCRQKTKLHLLDLWYSGYVLLVYIEFATRVHSANRQHFVQPVHTKIESLQQTYKISTYQNVVQLADVTRCFHDKSVISGVWVLTAKSFSSLDLLSVGTFLQIHQTNRLNSTDGFLAMMTAR